MADSDEVGDGDQARQALLPIAAQTLIEYQARSAHAAGARHIVVMVDQLPGALVGAFDRLRAEGLSIDVARSVRDAADRVHPDEDLLVIASGVVAGRDVMRSFAQARAPALLTLPEAPRVAHYERIDGSTRWGGLALLKGEHLRYTATLIGGWSLGPTLLRVAIQRDAARVALQERQRITIVADEPHARSVSARLVDVQIADAASPFATLAGPLAALAASGALARSLPFDIVQIVAPALFAVAIALVWMETPAFGFGAFVLAAIAGMTAARYGAAAMRPSPLLRWRRAIEQAAFAIAILFTAALTWRDGGGWGVNILALWTIANAAMTPRSTRWGPQPGDLALIMLFASALGAPAAGLSLCIIWQLAAQAYATRLVTLASH